MCASVIEYNYAVSFVVCVISVSWVMLIDIFDEELVYRHLKYCINFFKNIARSFNLSKISTLILHNYDGFSKR